MDLLRYAESAAALVNAPLDDLPALEAHLSHRVWLLDDVTPRDVRELGRFRDELRLVFVASAQRRVGDVVAGVNALLARHPVTPTISDHDPGNLHLHVADSAATVSELLVSEALMGVATVVCDLGPTRLGVCAAEGCDDVFVDVSPNASRRYCSERCASRSNVAAFRARRRAASSG